MNEVAYLGPRGTFTYEATQALFPKTDFQHTPCNSIPDVLTAVDQGEVAYGVVPVENAIEGSVNLTHDWLVHHVHVQVTGELIYPIKQNLMIHTQNRMLSPSRFTQVLSHPQAIAQCQSYLRKHLPNIDVTYVDSTAEAARQVAENPEENWVAIGPQSAGKIYHLSILSTDIQDYPNNFTRFIAVGKPWSHPSATPSGKKSSLLVTLPTDFPGALYRVLSSFAKRGVNLSRIESRPTKRKLGTYHFFIDAEQESNELDIIAAVDEIKAWGCQVRHLGSYPCYFFEKIGGTNRVDNRER
ncbi:prephenate dehydratase [Melghirimyces algeriensis]|uniref:Prephenate dehydratase n=1 Tax=Melghirimyces algeriensis TaxID=910412 RepID=A0A521ATT8_9BACL|nr:prephenate dehydratase [Melghirimyces algeriensis]SMO38030.1 prephenate dehydratase [Melghirimyces algeriensis]